MLRLIALLLFVVWLVLVIAGKGGFAHMLLLNALGVAAIEILATVRGRLRDDRAPI